MRINMVFNLESIKELQELTKALESAATVLDLARMKQEIQECDSVLEKKRKEIEDLAAIARKIKASLEPQKEGILNPKAMCEDEDESPSHAVTMGVSRHAGLSERR